MMDVGGPRASSQLYVLVTLVHAEVSVLSPHLQTSGAVESTGKWKLPIKNWSESKDLW